MPPDEARQSPQSFVRLSSPWKHSGDVRVERDYNAALGVAGGVLARPRLTEIVLRKNLVNSNPAGWRLFNFIFPHILSAHCA
jgi:hypothetical protein